MSIGICFWTNASFMYTLKMITRKSIKDIFFSSDRPRVSFQIHLFVLVACLSLSLSFCSLRSMNSTLKRDSGHRSVLCRHQMNQLTGSMTPKRITTYSRRWIIDTCSNIWCITIKHEYETYLHMSRTYFIIYNEHNNNIKTSYV